MFSPNNSKPTPQHHYYLIDVRTPQETLANPSLPGSKNVEYQDINLFVTSPAAPVPKDAKIDLYCRSGRRSGIAKAGLEELGYVNVRDLGALEMAREVLESERLRGGKGGKGGALEMVRSAEVEGAKLRRGVCAAVEADCTRERTFGDDCRYRKVGRARLARVQIAMA